MAGTACIGDVLEQQFHRNNSYKNNRYIKTSENPLEHKNELPEWLTPWAQNKSWAIRLSKLLEKGYEPQLRRFVRYSEEQGEHITEPQHHFNRSWSHKKLEQTLAFMNRLLDFDRHSAEVLQRLRAGKENAKAVYAACWRWGEPVIRHAVTAQETAIGDVFKYFCWLTSPKRLGEMYATKT